MINLDSFAPDLQKEKDTLKLSIQNLSLKYRHKVRNMSKVVNNQSISIYSGRRYRDFCISSDDHKFIYETLCNEADIKG